jgi:hypothetical protein
MRFWWVNQNQTYRHEVAGGYLWSPKVKANGDRNPYYEFMREVAPGDMIFSFADTRIRAYGVARSHAYEAAKPEEFGSAGRNWDAIGWRVDVEYFELQTFFRPADWIERLRPLLPHRYAPLNDRGHGSQSVYLTELPELLALTLADLVSADAAAMARAQTVAQAGGAPVRIPEQMRWENHIRQSIEGDPTITDTVKEALVLARRGQGLFRARVQTIETHCRVTRVDRPEHLRASHCKPWRDASNEERLDGDNGLMLTPTIDHLFDRGFISFESSGQLLISPVAHAPSLEKMGVPVGREVNVGSFRTSQERYLEFHRDAVFLRARLRAY